LSFDSIFETVFNQIIIREKKKEQQQSERKVKVPSPENPEKVTTLNTNKKRTCKTQRYFNEAMVNKT